MYDRYVQTADKLGYFKHYIEMTGSKSRLDIKLPNGSYYRFRGKMGKLDKLQSYL